MESSTKSKILEEALVMFAENGYKGTNLRELAARLGLSKSALYKHYESKEAIWNALLDKMEAYYAQRFGSVENPPPSPTDWDVFLAMCMRMLLFTVNDPLIILTRKLLTTEQFHDKRVCKLATKHFLEGTAGIFEKMFAAMMQIGLMRQDDPALLAFSFTAPITALIHLCDREPARKEAALQQAEVYFRRFIALHRLQ